MKKLDYNHLTTGALTVDASHLIGVVNDLIDLVNSQQEAIGELQTEIGVLRNMVLQSQEAIEKLEKRLGDVDTVDGGFNLWGRDIDKRLIEVEKELSLRPIGAEIIDKGWTGEPINKIADTHRTVTLRIPKGMTFVEALFYADLSLNMSDNQAKKALDEVQPNE